MGKTTKVPVEKVEFLKEGSSLANVERIHHSVSMPVETATLFYGKFEEYKEKTKEDMTFAEYLGRVVLGGLHDLMEGRLPRK